MSERELSGVDWAWFFEGLHRARSGLHPTTVDRLLRARALIETRFAEPIELDDLARAACYSRFHFLRLFEQGYGQTPGRFLQQRRLREARRLLAETDRPVSEVSLAVGFRSLGTFGRTFRDRVGASPVEYRRRVFPAVPVSRAARIPSCFLHRFGAGIATSEKPGPGPSR